MRFTFYAVALVTVLPSMTPAVKVSHDKSLAQVEATGDFTSSLALPWKQDDALTLSQLGVEGRMEE